MFFPKRKTPFVIITTAAQGPKLLRLDCGPLCFLWVHVYYAGAPETGVELSSVYNLMPNLPMRLQCILPHVVQGMDSVLGKRQ